MMRKMLSTLLVGMLIATMFLVADVRSDGAKPDLRYPIYGTVWDADGVEILDDAGNWNCTNITVYSVDGTVESAVCDASTKNESESHDDEYYDIFRFDSVWRDGDVGKEGICVGKASNGGINYVFITNFTFTKIWNPFEEAYKYSGASGATEWEPIPTPIVYAKGDTWVNIAIPKFANPQKELYSNITPNTDNTVGFAVYRNGLFVGNTTSEGTAYYFFKDTGFSSACNYSVSPILKGNYPAYSRSANLSSDESAVAPLSVVLESPNGGEYWAGGNEQNIKYSIAGGLAPYTVTLSYSTSEENVIKTLTKEEEGTYTNSWTPNEDELFNANMVTVKVEVTDDAFVSKNDTSDNTFVIDSTVPTVQSTIPPDGGSVSIKKHVTIVFSEPMDDIPPYHATQAAFSISPDPLGWSWEWNIPNNDTMIGTHNDFTFGETYTITITTVAKDLAGNYLAEDYSWSFTANMSIAINSPKLGDVWTGGSTHNIEYEITGGVAPYTITIDYTTDDGLTYQNITTTPITQNALGVYNFPWELPTLDLTTVNVRITLIDANGTKSVDPSRNFEIDSTAPFIITYTGNDTYITTTEDIMVVFSEEMNKASAESAFTIKDSSDNPVNGTFSWDGNVMSFIPNETLIPNMNYTAMVNTNATDKSDPGNALDKDYSWNFIAIEGRGDFVIALNVPSSPEKGKRYTITVTVSNTGDEAFNISGLLTVKFYASMDGKTWDIIDTKYVQNIWEGNNSCASTTYMFEDYGSYYFLVEVTSKNPADTFPGGETTGRASASVNIPQPSEEIGLGPYTLIALMVVIVVIAAALILLSLKKKGELTLKEKKKEKEETEKESEEEEEKGEE